jgi:tRNA A37 threonylcarbamoyladenosine modification protein TsaB
MLILGIDTTTKTAAVAIVNFVGRGAPDAPEPPSSLRALPLEEGGCKILSEMQSCGLKSHSENLMPMIDYTLKCAGVSLNDIDLFAVSHGPG